MVEELAAEGDFSLLMVEMAILESVAKSPLESGESGFDQAPPMVAGAAFPATAAIAADLAQALVTWQGSGG